jgi:aminocarboxymuconate-semialdehyde decarboxylase
VTRVLSIDVHSHLWPEGFIPQVRRLIDSVPPGMAQTLTSIRNPIPILTDPEVRLAEMDAAGVDITVLSLSPPGVTIGPVAQRADLARIANDGHLEVARTYPGRFAVMIALPLPDLEASIAELNRVCDEPYVRAINIQTATGEGWSIDHSRFLPLHQHAAEIGMPMMLHPAVEPLPDAWNDFKLATTYGTMTSSSLSVARMILSGTLDRVQGLDVIVPHLGGVLPYLAQRFDDFGRQSAANDFSWYLAQRLWFDTCSFHRPALRCAVETCGTHRLMMGTDYPARGPIQRAVDDIRGAFSDPADVAAVLGGTASTWFDVTEHGRVEHGART